MYYESFDGIFVLSACGLLVGVITATIRMCYKSKCKNFSCCWNCITIHRDTSQEIDIDIERNQHSSENEDENEENNEDSNRDIIPISRNNNKQHTVN
jgi:hypothetical protein